jgi:hypothetical protein
MAMLIFTCKEMDGVQKADATNYILKNAGHIKREVFGSEYLDICEIYGMTVSYRSNFIEGILRGTITGNDIKQAKRIIKDIGVKLEDNY